MEDSLRLIREQTMASLVAVQSEAELEALRQSVFGKAGSLSLILRGMGKLAPEERANAGKIINETKAELESVLNTTRTALQASAMERRFAEEALDVTEPGVNPLPKGGIHPMTQTYRVIRDTLIGMGFTMFDGPEIDSDDNCFTLLNLPKDHPARDMQDTFYINEDTVLRPHTSPLEIRALKTLKPPFRLIMPGRVFRADELDAGHSPVFMQMEGFVVDRGLSMAHLKHTLESFIHAMFGNEVKVRLRPSYFPFTEPSAEADMSCTICGGHGCRVCKGTGWVEILGCGMTNPYVLKNCGLDPKEWSAFAFGLGVDRMTSLKHGIPHIRLEYENDARFLRQF